MKLLLLAIGLFVAVNSLPFNDPEYAMVPDQYGWKLVNINEDPEPENFFAPETDIIFTLFTNENQEGQVIRWDDISTIIEAGFNADNLVRVTIHGWNGGPTSQVNAAVRQAYFEHGQFNVIEVDWSAGAGTINYIAARNRVDSVGVVTASLLRLISENTGVGYDRMSVIGHSLGAHVAGFVGKNLGSALASIVALDAALPLFSINNPEARVNSEDAIYVESIHTNAGSLGFDQPLGHANFYPNGGSSQPGCGLDITGNCAHGRAHEFFAESITSTVGFWAMRCADYTAIVNGNCESTGEYSTLGGEPLNTSAEGVFHLTTNSASPFAQGR